MIQYDISESLKQFYVLNGRSVCPLVVGVSGHRDIADDSVDKIRDNVRKTLKELCDIWRSANNNNPDVPILILDGMATGADQLVAEEVLKLKESSPKMQCLKLISVLPFEWSEYQKDFYDLDTEVGLNLVESLREQADAEIVIHAQGEDPDEKYVPLGKVIAHSSYILLALWDGEPGDPGGTGEVVRFQLKGTDPKLVFVKDHVPVDKEPWLGVQPCGCVYQIVTPRKNQPLPPNAGKCILHTIQDNEIVKTMGSLAATLKKTDFKKGIDFLGQSNCDMLAGSEGEEDVKKKSEMYLLDDLHPAEDGNLATLVRYYKEFDALSDYYQNKKFKPSLKKYLIVTCILGLLFYCEVFWPNSWIFGYSRFPSNSNWSDWGCLRIVLDICYYIVLVYLIASFIKFRNKDMFYERYHRYRAVAEALRVQIFWYIANISEPVMNSYHNHPIPEMDWVRNTLNTIHLPICITYDRPEDHRSFEYLYERWPQNQRDYFRDKIKQHSASADRCQNIQLLWGVIAFIWILFRIWPSRFLCLCETVWLQELIRWTVICCTLFFAIGGVVLAALFVWSRFCCYESQANRYKRVYPKYKQYCDYIAPDDVVSIERSDEEIQNALYCFGKEALAENADWFLTQRKLTFPS